MCVYMCVLAWLIRVWYTGRLGARVDSLEAVTGLAGGRVKKPEEVCSCVCMCVCLKHPNSNPNLRKALVTIRIETNRIKTQMERMTRGVLVCVHVCEMCAVQWPFRSCC